MKTALKRFFCVAFISVLLCRASAAIEPRQLVSPFLTDDEHVAFGGNDLHALLKDESRPLGQIAAKIVLPLVRGEALPPPIAECVDRIGPFAALITKDENSHRESVFAAEIRGELPAAPTGAGYTIENAPEGTTLAPVGIYTLNGRKIYCAFLSRSGQNFVIGAENDPALLNVIAAAPDDAQTDKPSYGHPLWVKGYTPPSRLSKVLKSELLPQALQKPLRFEIGLDQTERSIRAHIWYNLSELFAVDEFPAPREKTFLIGSNDLYGLLSFEGFAAALTPHLDKLEQAAAVVGLSAEDLAAVLSHRITIGAAGKSSGLIGSFPGFYIHLAGAEPVIAEKLLALATTAAKDRTSKTETFTQGAWHGIRMSRWAMFSAFAAASEQGFVLAFQDSRELERTPSPAPEISQLLSQDHRFILCFDAQALMNKLDSALNMIGSLFMNDEQQRQMESAFKLMEAFGVFTLVADSIEESSAELYVNQPAFGQLLDDLSARVRLKADRPSAQPIFPSPDTPEPAPARPQAAPQAFEPTLQFTAFSRASQQFKKLFPSASIAPRTCVASALYDGKPVTMTTTLIEGEGVQLRFVSAVRSTQLKIGPERAERLAREWLEKNASSPCELTSTRSGDETEIEVSLAIPYSADMTDAKFVKQADTFLAALDDFYDLAKR